MARRSRGEGSVHRSPDGKGWVAILELPAGPGGRRIRRKRRAKNKTEAIALLRQMKAEAAEHGDTGNRQRQMSSTLDDYLEVRVAEGVAGKTLELDLWMLRLIDDYLGHKRVASLSVGDCDRFLAAAAAGKARAGSSKPIGRSALRRVRSTLIRVLRNDLRLGLVNRNVAELSVLPPDWSMPGEKRALSYDELDALCQAATGATAVLIDLSGRNGLRPAEGRALRWVNVDLGEGLITIDGQMSAENEFVGPKTRRAGRTIRIDRRTTALLTGWRERQTSYRSAAGDAWLDFELVAATRSGRPIQRHNFGRALAQLCVRLGIEPAITPYELRHTAITLQSEAGHAAWQIADWAGTSERMISEVYRHKLSGVAPLGSVGPM